jgi:NodT family efflux transporter outer membrane factor (OMF) lipoprotein
VRLGRAAAVCVALLPAACAVGPNYARPSAPVPPAFKETPPPGERPEDWKPAEPGDAVSRGKWWEIFGDPELNALEEQVDAANQDLARAEAVFRAARAVARGARADLFPVVTGSASVTRARRPAANGGKAVTSTVYEVPFDLSWEADVFGRIRRNVEANVAAAQASAADRESVRLSLHAELAADWLQLHGIDGQKQLLDDVVAGYATALKLTRNRHDQGVVSGVDVAQAETQLETTRVEATDLEVDRARLEHAIAILVGKPPAELAIPRAPLRLAPPPLPLLLPSELIERRPDVAAAERRVASANAQVGVATAAFFPRLLLDATAGWQSGGLSGLFSLPNRIWSIGPSVVETIFSGGKRRAGVEQARASYDATVAEYRQSVLAALQEVEDDLAATRVLEEEARQEEVAVAASERLLTLSRNRYQGGITTYLEVVVAEAAAVQNRRAAVDLLTRRMTAGVDLVKALGGGWDASTLPSKGDVLSRSAAGENKPDAGVTPRP